MKTKYFSKKNFLRRLLQIFSHKDYYFVTEYLIKFYITLNITICNAKNTFDKLVF